MDTNQNHTPEQLYTHVEILIKHQNMPAEQAVKSVVNEGFNPEKAIYVAELIAEAKANAEAEKNIQNEEKKYFKMTFSLILFVAVLIFEFIIENTEFDFYDEARNNITDNYRIGEWVSFYLLVGVAVITDIFLIVKGFMSSKK